MVSTTSVHTLVQAVHVKSDFVSSDHVPLCFDIAIDKTNICTSPSVCSSGNDVPTFNWKDLTDNDLLKYNVCTKKDLSRIYIPLEALKCSDMSCSIHQKVIDCFFIMILLILSMDALENVFLLKTIVNILL